MSHYRINNKRIQYEEIFTGASTIECGSSKTFFIENVLYNRFICQLWQQRNPLEKVALKCHSQSIIEKIECVGGPKHL